MVGDDHALPDADRCYERHSITEVVPEPPPEDLKMFVEACEADAQDCRTLCYQILYRENSEAILDSCQVDHQVFGHTVKVGYTIATGEPGCGTVIDGRRPLGLRHARRQCPDRVSAHLARSAFFEAGSVYAFVGLARELTRHGAPASLIRAAQRSASDEVTHARLIGELARRRGVIPPRASVSHLRARSIESIALENAREGVVGEAWAATIALWQARHAPSPEVRAVYERIAHDEISHAELSHEVDRWARAKLSRPAGRRIDRERDCAISRIGRSIGGGPGGDLVRELGMPDGPAMQRLLAAARPTLRKSGPT